MVIYVDVNPDGKILGYSKSPMVGFIEYDAPQDFIDCPFKCKYLDGQFVIDEIQDRIISNEINSREYQTFLNETDWQVVRHRDQLELGIETSLTNEEFFDLLRARQDSRDKIINK